MHHRSSTRRMEYLVGSLFIQRLLFLHLILLGLRRVDLYQHFCRQARREQRKSLQFLPMNSGTSCLPTPMQTASTNSVIQTIAPAIRPLPVASARTFLRAGMRLRLCLYLHLRSSNGVGSPSTIPIPAFDTDLLRGSLISPPI